MPLGNLRTEHVLHDKVVSEDELRQATYALNQQREARQPAMQKLPTTPPKATQKATKPSTTTPDSDALLKAANKDLRTRNIT